MAAMLTEEERAPAVQEFGRAEFERFVKACLELPIPIPSCGNCSGPTWQAAVQTDNRVQRDLKASQWTSMR
jgi:hypothetical protein